tara:strand:- start:3916 stop:4107 length:192 start_codon:yes stop_codon:yes gene_type:complete
MEDLKGKRTGLGRSLAKSDVKLNRQFGTPKACPIFVRVPPGLAACFVKNEFASKLGMSSFYLV